MRLYKKSSMWVMSMCGALVLMCIGEVQGLTFSHDVHGLAEYRQAMVVANNGQQVIFAGGARSDSSGNNTTYDLYDATAAAGSRWSSGTLPHGTRGKEMAGGALGGKLYVGTGWRHYHNSENRIETYDPATGTWAASSINYPSGGTYRIGSTTVGNQLVFYGGQTGHSSSTAQNSVNILQLNPDGSTSWLPTRNSPTKRYFVMAETVGNLAVFAGGRNTSHKPINAMEVYNSTTDTWDGSMSLPHERANGAMVAADGKVWITGGQDYNNNVMNTMFVYDPNAPVGSEWNTITMPTARAYHAATTLGDYIFVGGGYNPTGYLDSIDVYQISTGQWLNNHGMSLSVEAVDISATTIGDQVIFAGGRRTPGTHPDYYHQDNFSNVADIFTIETADPIPAPLAIIAAGPLLAMALRRRSQVYRS